MDNKAKLVEVLAFIMQANYEICLRTGDIPNENARNMISDYYDSIEEKAYELIELGVVTSDELPLARSCKEREKHVQDVLSKIKNP